MRSLFIFSFLLLPAIINAQSKSVSRFRDHHKENSNLFFYKSTLNMLNSERNKDLAEILDDVEEIRVLNYSKSQQNFGEEEIKDLRKSIEKENYQYVLVINENGNSITLYNRTKRDKTVGFLSIVENDESLILIDLTGSVDVKKFMQIKDRLDNREVNQL